MAPLIPPGPLPPGPSNSTSLPPYPPFDAGLASTNDHKMLYHFLGQVEVLQPRPDADFMLPGEEHDMLPSAPNLYRLREPPPCGFSPNDYELTGQLCVEDDLMNDSNATLSDAVWLFMNNPHPLSTLSAPEAYGGQGSISRFHNPESYIKALSGLLAR